jgi:hypothetical protein
MRSLKKLFDGNSCIGSGGNSSRLLMNNQKILVPGENNFEQDRE